MVSKFAGGLRAGGTLSTLLTISPTDWVQTLILHNDILYTKQCIVGWNDDNALSNYIQPHIWHKLKSWDSFITSVIFHPYFLPHRPGRILIDLFYSPNLSHGPTSTFISISLYPNMNVISLWNSLSESVVCAIINYWVHTSLALLFLYTLPFQVVH